MKNLKQTILILLVCSFFSASCFALEKGTVQFDKADMTTTEFLDVISEKLEISIDASAIDLNSSQVFRFPELGPISGERAKSIVLSLLFLKGYTWIFDEQTNVYRIARLRDARDEEIPFILDRGNLPQDDLLVTLEMKVKHVSSEYLARTLRAFMPANSRIVPFPSNTIFITDSAYNIAKLEKLVFQLDTEETAAKAKRWLEKKGSEENDCAGVDGNTPSTVMMTVLFSLVALVIGFLMRGYVIRRIEGGL